MFKSARVLVGVLAIWCSTGWAKSLDLATYDYPPYMVNQTGQPSGLVIELLTEAFHRLHVEVRFSFMPWARALEKVRYGEVDGLFTIKKTPEREQFLLYPQHILISQQYYFFSRKGTDFSLNGDLAAISRFKIGVVNKTAYGKVFDTAVNNQLLTRLDYANDYLLTFKKLQAGRVDAVICSKLVGLQIIRELHANQEIQTVGPMVNEEGSYLAWTKVRDYQALAERLDQTLSQMQLDGTFSRISARYVQP